MNNYDNISCLKLDLNGIDFPVGVIAAFEPIYQRRAWIPQPMIEQIWVLYEFKTEEDRRSWETQLPLKLRNCLNRDIIRNALSYGWGSMDINGFKI